MLPSQAMQLKYIAQHMRKLEWRSVERIPPPKANAVSFNFGETETKFAQAPHISQH